MSQPLSFATGRAVIAAALLVVVVGCGAEASDTDVAPEPAATAVSEIDSGASPAEQPDSETAASTVVPPVAAPTENAVGEDSAPSPTDIPAEEAVSQDGLTQLVMESTTDDYFVLYVRPDLDGTREIPLTVVLGEAGTTTVTDGRMQLPEKHYRVETLSVSAPSDIDGDGIDDLTELADPVNLNPLNPGMQVALADGAVMIPDQETFSTLSYQGDDVARDGYLAGLEFVKFWLIDVDSPNPTLYFMNTEAYRAHSRFTAAVGLPIGRADPGTMRGDIVYDPHSVAPDGTLGTYRFAFQPNDAFSFEYISLTFEMLSSGMPFLTNNLLYEPYPTAALPLYETEQDLYEAYRIPILLQP